VKKSGEIDNAARLHALTDEGEKQRITRSSLVDQIKMAIRTCTPGTDFSI
jgi:hypothetical protein